MKRFILVCMCLLVFCGLIGCKTQKAVTQVGETTTERTDTTKVASDSIHMGSFRTEHRTTLRYYSDWGYIEFGNSGGTITIDSVGAINAVGVKAYHQGKEASRSQTKSIAQKQDSTGISKHQENGIQTRESKKAGQEPQKQGVKALKWYQRTIYHIGFLCCIAAIIYAIFLYLRGKR